MICFSGPCLAAISLNQSATTAETGSQTATVAITASAGDLIILHVDSNPNVTPNAPSTVTDAAGLTWHFRNGANYRGNTYWLGYYYAVTPGVLSSDTITVTMTASTIYKVKLIAYSVTGADIVHPFDTNGSLPFLGNDNVNCTSGTTCGGTISTTCANTMLITGADVGSNTSVALPSGFTLIQQQTTLSNSAAYDIVSSAQSSVALSYSFASPFTATSVYIDAIRASTCPAIISNNIFFTGLP